MVRLSLRVERRPYAKTVLYTQDQTFLFSSVA